MKPHLYKINEGSGFAPLTRGPVTFEGAALDLSAADVQVRIVRGSTSMIAWDAADGAAVGDADGMMSWSLPTGGSALADGTYDLWWRFQRDGEQPCVIGPDVLQIRNVP